jgi:hypothetical protein
MSERDIDINVSKTSMKDVVPNEEFLKGYRARLAQVLERGVVADRLQVETLPDHLYGEWVPADDRLEITRKEALGFWIDDQYAKQRALHDSGDSSARIGDVVFMVTHKAIKVEIDKLHHARFMEMHNPKQLKEEQDFKAKNQLSNIDRNRTHNVGATDILDSLRAMKNDVVVESPNVMTITETKAN